MHIVHRQQNCTALNLKRERDVEPQCIAFEPAFGIKFFVIFELQAGVFAKDRGPAVGDDRPKSDNLCAQAIGA